VWKDLVKGGGRGRGRVSYQETGEGNKKFISRNLISKG